MTTASCDYVACPSCQGLGRTGDAMCDRCEATGLLPACLNCGIEPRDPLFAPCCSGACRDVWETKEARVRLELGLDPLPLVKRAP